MILQDIFDTVSVHLLRQGRKAADRGERQRCMLRAPDGARCAVGCLIPDEAYDPADEFMQLHQLWKRDCRASAYLHGLAPDVAERTVLLALLVSLQDVHDSGLCAYWVDELRGVAELYALSTGAMDRYLDGLEAP